MVNERTIGVARVSIHAPRVGCDRLSQFQWSRRHCFNSRTPCGVRLRALIVSMQLVEFQFTHPVWGATTDGKASDKETEVSIHAPRVGCDSKGISASATATQFQFTHPVWGATGRDH